MELTGINQLWVADITYIRLQFEFVYLAVILDAFSQRLIGWELGRTLEGKLTVNALRKALAARGTRPGLVHHSDRGVQYASIDYTNLLKERGIQISMSRKGNPYDNAKAESFIKTLKYEEVYRSDYRDEREVRCPACLNLWWESKTSGATVSAPLVFRNVSCKRLVMLQGLLLLHTKRTNKTVKKNA